MASKYVDIPAIIQVIGSVLKTPQLLDYSDKYVVTDEDFPDEFHKIVFGTIYNLHILGAERIGLNNILDYLSSRPKSQAIFIKQKGEEWIAKAIENADPATFDFYYNRMKKMTLLRELDNYGFDVKDIYDPDNIIDLKKRQQQEDYLDNSSLETIAQQIQNKLDEVKSTYVDGSWGEAYQAGDSIDELLDELKEHPDVGVPLYGPLINTVLRGARLKKFYLRSAPTGVGKSRSMIADCCYIGCNRLYDENFGWIRNGTSEPVLYITTEQELSEIQTMMLAFLSNVNEEHIIDNKYLGDEEERVREAARLLKEAPIYVEVLPDFSLQDVEDKIKKNIRDHDVKYVCFDYIHTSLKILEEITRRAGGVKLREDNILFMLSIRLKDLCNKYGIFIISSTQLNADYVDSDTPDQNLLRGAKAIADKIDAGMILLPTTEEDIEKLQRILVNNAFDRPSLKLSVYKNRRARYKGIYLWCKADLGTCRVEPMFATTWTYEIINISNLKIITDEPGAFDND